MRRKNIARITAVAVVAAAATAAALTNADDAFREGTAITAEPPAPPLALPEKGARKRLRNYPEQPPTIPHSIDGYETSLRGNKCLSCHSRRRSAETGAPMIGVSHFADRDQQVRSDLAPRRYFCMQCHVPQTAAQPPVDSDFTDAADIAADK